MKNFIYILTLLPTIIWGQERRLISGRLTDIDTKEPIIGASVYVSLEAIEDDLSVTGAITDIDGKFSFSAPQSVKNLIISYTGYESQTIRIADISTTDMAIEMKASTVALDEVVLTGYQETTMRKSTSSYFKIASKDIKQSGVANVDQLLNGQLPGVYVQPTNGAPGAPAKINIRGVSTLNGASDPLWVLDGVPLEGDDIPKDFRDKDNIDQLRSYPIAGINPDDIESITVLKDASATSIYGARAANGVIVITTKSGKSGKARINVNVSTFITQKPDFSKLKLMDSNQKVDFELYLASRSDLKHQSYRGEVARILNNYGAYDEFANNGFANIDPKAQTEINKLRETNTIWGDELYQTAVNKQIGLSMSGGSEKSNYYFSVGYFDEKGATQDTGQKRFNLTLKNKYSITERFKVGIAVFGSQNKTFSYLRGIDGYTSPSIYSRTANPYLSVFDDKGGFRYDPDLIERSDSNLKYNIQEERQNTENDFTTNSLKSIVDIKYAFKWGLVVNSQLGLQIDNDKGEIEATEQSYFTRKYELRSAYLDNSGNRQYYLPKGGIIQNTNANKFQYNWKTTLNYGQVFYQEHDIDILLGTEFRENKNTTIFTRGFGFNPNTLTTTPITNERAQNNASFQSYRKTFINNAYVSFFGTLSYTYKSRYSIFSSLRYDGSNLFGVNPKYRYLPIWSVAGSWNLANESFLYSKSLDILKLRVSYGIQGNIDKSTSPFVIGTYDTGSILPGIQEETIRALGAPNANLRWEKTTSSNIGMDFGLWTGKVLITADYYHRRSTDLIGLKSTPLELGYNFINTNWATVVNKGVEISIRTKNIAKDEFQWSTAFNIASNRNIVERIENREEDFKPSLQGHSVNAVFAIQTDGLDGNGLPIFVRDGELATAVDFFNLKEGTNGSQLSREQHRSLYKYVGDAAPKFTGGINNSFTYKQFDLNISANFNIDQIVKRTPSYHPTIIQPGSNYSTEVLGAGTNGLPAFIGLNSEGIDTRLVYQWYNNGDAGNTYRDLDIWVKNISYIRINSIRLGYSLPKALIDKMKIASMRFYVEGRNLLVISTDYSYYFDPETYGSPYAQPIPKMISAGLNVSF